ncbi:MAG: trypsin-like peptidase domain-containing protein [bacterium]
MLKNAINRGLAVTLGILLIPSYPSLSGKAPPLDADAHPPDLSASVVRIEVAMQEPDYRSPWDAGRIEGGVGSGFVISGKRILTNAHVVSNARFITLTREGLSHPYIARVRFIAHDCDLAILSVDDASFFEGTRELSIGGVPSIESAVSVYGYPLGGERLSVTRGVVSRIDFQPYSHSAVDSHLVIQIDAAINPGNSGGPVLQNGKVVGVAFQGYSGDVAQNVGFMIPTPVINRFLKDISKGSYTGYTDLSLSYRPLISPTSRRALGLEKQYGGVLVTDVQEAGSSAGFIHKGDILISIDGHPITSDARVELEGTSVEMAEVVERKLAGDKVNFEVLREGKTLNVEFPLLGTWPFHMQSHAYDQKPRYLLHGGLLFQPLDRNFMAAIGAGDLRLRRTFDDFVDRHLYLERPEVVVLSRVLADPVNKDCDGLHPGIVDTINGKKIRSLADVKTAFAIPGNYDVILLMGSGVPIVLNREEVIKTSSRILESYRIPSPENLN